MMPVLTPANFNTSILDGKKIEFIVQNQNFKNNFWVNVAPINSVGKAGKIDFVQIKQFVSDFFNQLDKKRDFFDKIPLITLMRYFIEGSSELLSFNPSKISVELTSAKSVFLLAKKDDKNIYFEIFFDDTTGKFSEVVVNIYKNKTQCLAINGPINKVVQEIGEFLKPASTNYYNYLESTYAISDDTTPANAF